MLPDRNRPQGPGFRPTNGRRMQHPGHLRGPQHQYHPPFQPMRMAQYSSQGTQGFQGPFIQQQRHEQMPVKKEGLLSKILGKSKQNAAPPNLFAPVASSNQGSSRNKSGGFLETLKNPDSLNDMLNNTQKVLQAAEQFTPMVQQYGPVIKNLPSMWKVISSLTSSDDPEKSDSENNSKKESPKAGGRKAETNNQESVKAEPSATVRPKTRRKTASGPKLYI